MYLFSRNATCTPERMAEAHSFAVEIASKASSIIGTEVMAWQVVYGAPAGSLAWTAVFDSYTTMVTAADKLAVDPGYTESARAGAQLFLGPSSDAFINIVARAGDRGHRGEFATLITAQCVLGKVSKAMAWGVEIGQYASKLTGLDTVFGRSVYGPFGGVGWLSLAASAEELDGAAAAMASDAGYLAKLDSGAGLFIEGSGQNRLSRRIA